MALTVVHKAKKRQFAGERRALLGTTAMYQGETLIRESELLTTPANNNRYGVVAKATNSFEKRIQESHEMADDYANARLMAGDDEDMDADSASASRNHFLSAMEEIRDNKDLDSPEAIKLFLNEIKVRNAAEVLLAGKIDGYALDALDHVMDFLTELGKGDIQRGIEELQSDKVDEERLENRASVVSEKVTISRQQADELAKQINQSDIRNLPVGLAKAEFERLTNNRLVQPDEMNKLVGQLDQEVVERVVEQREKNTEETGTKTHFYDKDRKQFTDNTIIGVVAEELVDPIDKDKRRKEAPDEEFKQAGHIQKETEKAPNLMAMTFDTKGNLIPSPGKPKRA